MNTLPTRLTVVMQELGLEKPKNLAEFCGVSEGLVSQWFSGRTKLGPKPLRALSHTHFNLDWVVDGRLPKYRAATSMKEVEDPSVIAQETAPLNEKDAAHGEGDLVLVYRLAADPDKAFLLGVADAIRRRMIVEGTWEGPKLAARA
jgi:transcriptional regulator with XRE-family HTH domain